MFVLFVSKTSFSINPVVNLRWTNDSCIGGERGLLSTCLWIRFKASSEVDVCSTHCQKIEYNSSLYIPDLNSCSENWSSISNITFEFVQPEHGGVLCHCVEMNFINEAKIFKLAKVE